jgi:hypothetical protein
MTERTCDDCVTLELCRPFVAEEKVLFLCPDCYEERISELEEAAIQLLERERLLLTEHLYRGPAIRA